MSLYENWMKRAFTPKGQSVDAVWDVYLPLEQKVYEYIIGEKVQDMDCKISEIAERFSMTDEQAVAFVDGINDVLPEPYDVNELTADSEVKLHIEFDKLYKKMVEYKAEHLYTLPQWDGIFSEDERKKLYKEQKTSRTVVSMTVPRSEETTPAPAEAEKNIRNAAEQICDMETKIIKVDPERPDKSALEEAARILRAGGLVAFPTETVYGLGANGLDANACKKIYEAKGRPSDNPLILTIGDISGLYPIVGRVTENAKKIIDAFWPGPITLVLPKADCVPMEVTGGLDTVAVRFPSNAVARELIKTAGIPVAAPSANSSGKPSPTRASHVEFDLNGKIDMIIDGGPADWGPESTILDVSVDRPVLLRPGAVTKEMIEEIVGEIDVDPAVYSKLVGGHRAEGSGNEV